MLVPLALALAGGCAQGGSLLVVEVDAQARVSASELALQILAAGRERSFTLLLAQGAIPPAVRVGVEFPPDVMGAVMVVARAAGARASGVTQVRPGRRFDLALRLVSDGADPDMHVSAPDLASDRPADLAKGQGDRDALPLSCGDAVLDPDEECDDGDSVDGNGCDSNCTATRCGNGIVTTGEDCDDGNLIDGDSCPSTCRQR